MGIAGKKHKTKAKPSGQKQRKINPFELKFNKSKHHVLGKKTVTQVGAPTASRKRAHEQREKTIGVEYDRKTKISKIIDKRIGEKEGKNEEEKMALRFAEERAKNFKKASKFNLVDNDDDEEEAILTHGGKTLSDIEKYDKSMISDSDDDDDPGNIGAKMVKIAHFGGGEKTVEEMVKEKVSREDMISSMIAKSKMMKHEKQTAKDEMEMMTESLDAKFQALFGRVQSTFRPTGRQREEKDDFDKLALSLKIEADARATPAERKLTEAEMAAKEKQRLEELEAARISKTNAVKNAHLSADADVDWEAGAKADARKQKMKNSRFEVRFADDGTLQDDGKMLKHEVLKVRNESFDDDDDDEDVDDEADDEEEEDMDDLLEEVSDEEEEDDDEEEESEKPAKSSKKKPKITAETIPFIFEMPKSYKKFCDLLEKYSEHMELVLERIIKCNHPSLKEGNKTKLNKLFLMCLRWFDDMTKEDLDEKTLSEINLAQKTMFDLLKFDVQFGVRCIRALIRQHWKQRQDKLKSSPASFGLIALLRLVAALFPVADIWHPVCTPAFFLATCALSTAKIPSLEVLSRQILLATTLIEYIAETKRYIPELVSFARSALLLAVEEKPESFSSSGFPVSKPYSDMLCVAKKTNIKTIPPISLKAVFSDEPLKQSESLQLSVLRSLVSLVQHLRVLYSNQSETYNIVFRPFCVLLKAIKKDNLPDELREEIDILVSSIEAECAQKQRITQLSLVKTEKSMLKMLEPRFEYDFDPERPHKGKKNESKRMQKQLKNEMRGAVKELRKDTAFLARKQMAGVKAKDRARMAATKRLMGGLMQQQGEWNKEIRTKEVESKKNKK
ncbi:unnamed protein product [Caenorhabditis bovis]|uniref:Nucleolar protein 14 n=1 Tax=Caenorhabditis bovis TaxID=2654633 RepID=A0A8S1F570_9PELO|nr:unnamed protein product [Caenorhabditis bovis]